MKQKIINDPLLGFLSIPCGLLTDLVDHPYFQRLRHILQMGLSSYVYPGAIHSRLNHSLGCLMLMREALTTLRGKGVAISNEEYEACCTAILLHDTGHGPFSHVLEGTVVSGDFIRHENFSLAIMQKLAKEFGDKYNATVFQTAISIFKNEYHKPFLHQLISSQLDIDRLDYLNRDSFYTGVAEGAVGAQRIIRMMNVVNDGLVLEEKGIYSLEKFILSRRLMYMQVYIHKTSLGAEQLLIRTVRRARELILNGVPLFATDSFLFFLKRTIYLDDIDDNVLQHFLSLDDTDIWSSLKAWALCNDLILRTFSEALLKRRLFKSILQNTPFEENILDDLRAQFGKEFVFTEEIPVEIYKAGNEGIHILRKDGNIVDITSLSELLNSEFVNKKETKYLLCYPKKS
ncbi:MAG: HD domain-containing protein [Bacteroidales bacterium]|jgi:HD superfamily phosphohydrolase|nr:HD domain-containing protein [Bacteroidales bacterium]